MPHDLHLERISAIDEAIPPVLRAPVAWTRRWAAEQGAPIYLVGGFVRDLLLGRPGMPGGSDLDLLIEGDAIALARELAEATAGALQTHQAFGTATITWNNPAPAQLDLITARDETYPRPAALPVVRPADLAADLRRRDFTINTLAVELDQRGPRLHDQHGALDDLAAGLIRALHPASFIDDPTRSLRAARFAARLGFAIEARTGALIAEAVAAGMIDQTTPVRIRNEWDLLLGEPAAAEALALLDSLGVLAAILGGAAPALTPDLAAACRAVIARRLPPGEQRLLLSLILLLGSLPAQRRLEWARRYSLPRAELTLVEQLGRLEGLAPLLSQPELGNGALDRALAPFADPPLDALALLRGEPIAGRIAYYRAALRPVPSALTAADLLARGVPPGPEYRRLLAEARERQLDELGG